MGSNISKKIAEFQQDLSYLDFTKMEMKMLYKVFLKISTTRQDLESTITVTVGEILKYIGVPFSNFAARALCCGFCYVSASECENQEIQTLSHFQFDFRTFVYTLWNFVTLSPDALSAFIFSVYDADGGGSIDPLEAQTLLEDMHGHKESFSGNLEVMRAYNQFAMLVRKHIDLQRFQEFVHCNSTVFSPATQLQEKLSSLILGSVYWMIHAKKRKSAYGSHYKHVTRVVDKVRIEKERAMEKNWGQGGAGNTKYHKNTPRASTQSYLSGMLAAIKKGREKIEEQKEAAAREDRLEGMFPPPLASSSEEQECSLAQAGARDTAPKRSRNVVSFAEDVYSWPHNPQSPSSSGGSKYVIFGSRPNTPSKRISYFLDKFYEKSGRVSWSLAGLVLMYSAVKS